MNRNYAVAVCSVGDVNTIANDWTKTPQWRVHSITPLQDGSLLILFERGLAKREQKPFDWDGPWP